MTKMDQMGMDQRKRLLGRRGIVLGGVALALPFALAGCGRRSAPKPPEGSTFGQEYPTRRSMGLPPEEPAPAKDDEDETPSDPGRIRPPALR